MCRYAPHRNPAFEQGVIASQSGLDRDANPHVSGTNAHEAWDIGWLRQNVVNRRYPALYKFVRKWPTISGKKP